MDSNYRTKVKIVLFLICFLWLIDNAHSQGTSKSGKTYRFEGSKIEGEREKPKDLYILPWEGSTLLNDSEFELEFLRNAHAGKDRYQLEEEYNYFERVRIPVAP